MKASKPFLFVCLILLFGLSACLPVNLFGKPSDPGDIYTMAAKTVVAEATLSVGQTAIAQLTQIATGGVLDTPTGFNDLTSTPPYPYPIIDLPTAEPIQPTNDYPWPTLTPHLPPPPPPPPPVYPTPIPPQIPCDWAQYVQDVTTPDGAIFPPGVEFTKVWRIRNIGSCTWTRDYSLVFVNGDRMRAYSPQPIGWKTVYPGQTVDVAVDYQAPSDSGHYRSYWMLANARGRAFGIGPYANQGFWTDIRVLQSDNRFNYDFAISACAARWSSGSASSLPCPGSSGSSNGSVTLLDNPVFETGRHENELTLLTRPSVDRYGWIRGLFPSYKVRPGDHFMAEIGCLQDSRGCDVTFLFSYQVPGHPVKEIQRWEESYDGDTTHVDVDLSGLSGQTVQFILAVTTQGNPSRSNAFWLAPSIRRGSFPPPPPPPPPHPTHTATPTLTPTPTSTPDWNDNPAVQAARENVAQGLGIAVDQVIPTHVEQVEWSDTCLGVHQPGQMCGPAIIPGYRVILRVGNHSYEAHTNQDGSIVVWFEL